MNPFPTWLTRSLMALLGLAAALHGHAAPPAIEAFFQKPAFSDATLSPDGRLVAFLVGSKTVRTRLAVLDLESMKVQPVAAILDNDIARLWWVNNQRLMFNIKQVLTGPGRAEAGPGLYAVNTDGSNLRALVETRPTFLNAPPEGYPPLPWNSRPTDVPGRASGNEVYVARPQEVSRAKVDYVQIHRLNTATGRAVELEVPLHTVAWALDAQGEVQAALTAQEDRRAMHLRQPDGSWKQIIEFPMLGGDGMSPLWVGADGTIYVSAPQGDKAAVFALDATTGRPKEPPLAASKDFDLHPHFIANDRKLLGLRYTIDAEVTQWLDPAMQALQDTVDKLLPATTNRISVPRHGDAPWALVQTFSDVQPPLAYAYHRTTRKLTRLNGLPSELTPATLGQTDFVRYKARDGREIPAYLTLPPGGGKQLPLVVLVHGGPWARGSVWGWHPDVQFLASRGYAVLQPEFRGSTGYGYQHMEAGFKQWGLAMQDDLADGARWAVAQGHADAKRICIAGASYGGYATLMGLLRDPDLYRCGINWVGVTDINLLFDIGWSDITEATKQFSMRQMVGDPATDADRFKATSPLVNAARIQRPMLLAYGAWDVRVPLVHGERFLEAVKPHNKDVEWVVYPKEGHGWEQPETAIDFWGRVERFLARHIGKPSP